MQDERHDIDDIFRSALSKNSGSPSASVKDNLFANLDKMEAASYKKKSMAWKRVAVLLLLILSGFILFHSIDRTNADRQGENAVTAGNEPGDLQEGISPANDAPVNNLLPEKETGGKNLATDKIETGAEDPINTSPENLKYGRKINRGDQEIYREVHSIKRTTNLAQESSQETISDDGKSGGVLPQQALSDKSITEKNEARASIVAALHNAPADESNFEKIAFDMPSEIDSFLFSQAQRTNNNRKIRHFRPYWLVTGLASYDRVNYILDSDQPNAIRSIRHREVHEPSFSIAIMATRQLKEKWGIQSGIVYSNTAIGISQQKIFALQDPAGDIVYKYVTSSGYAYIKPGFGQPPNFGDSLLASEAKHKLISFNIPLLIKYSIGRNRLQLVPGAGIEGNFITASRLETEIEDASNRETVFINRLQGSRNFYWSLIADAEIRYQVNNRMAVNLRPVFRYALSPITENNVVETFPYSVGAGLGMTFKF